MYVWLLLAALTLLYITDCRNQSVVRFPGTCFGGERTLQTAPLSVDGHGQGRDGPSPYLSSSVLGITLWFPRPQTQPSTVVEARPELWIARPAAALQLSVEKWFTNSNIPISRTTNVRMYIGQQEENTAYMNTFKHVLFIDAQTEENIKSCIYILKWLHIQDVHVFSSSIRNYSTNHVYAIHIIHDYKTMIVCTGYTKYV